MPTQWYLGKVTEIADLSATTRQFSILIEDNTQIFNFIPGQFVTMDLPVSDKRLNRWRSYSIASHPVGDNKLEFCIVRSEAGLGTKYLFEEIQVGSILKFKGPDGGFVLPQNLENENIFICTGTGVAPFRSMIKHIEHHSLDFSKIHLIFGTRNKQNILYEEEFKSFALQNNRFIYDVALSREQHPDYNFGYVHDIYLNQYKEITPNRHFYICGWSSMIDEAVANLIIKLKYDKSQIHYELYG